MMCNLASAEYITSVRVQPLGCRRVAKIFLTPMTRAERDGADFDDC